MVAVARPAWETRTCALVLPVLKVTMHPRCAPRIDTCSVLEFFDLTGLTVSFGFAPRATAGVTTVTPKSRVNGSFAFVIPWTRRVCVPSGTVAGIENVDEKFPAASAVPVPRVIGSENKV